MKTALLPRNWAWIIGSGARLWRERLGRSRRVELRIVDLGRLGYRDAWTIQQQVAADRLKGIAPDTLLMVEHPPTITLGRGADPSNVIATDAKLAEWGIERVESDRGGDVTYHGPGQLVGYPILNLGEPPLRRDLHWYLRSLEEALIRALATFGIAAGRIPRYTGVWAGLDTPHPAKVAAIGIRVSHWITQHGFALNVCPDIAHFGTIIPCGINEHGVTSMARLLGRDLSVVEATPAVVTAFANEFGFQPVVAPAISDVCATSPA